MIDDIQKDISHHIQKHIVSVLLYQRVARFRDLRKPGVDTNLFAYHLKLLMRRGIVKKLDTGYTLDRKGLVYIDRFSDEQKSVRMQPKIVTMLVIQNAEGDLLLWKRSKQPYMDMWTLPHGKVHIDDPDITVAARRETLEKLKIENANVHHAGDCYVRVRFGTGLVSATLIHVFKLYVEITTQSEQYMWVRPHKLQNYQLAPAVEQIVARTFFNDPYFFEEFDVSWS